jgi:hypothetical protein
VLAHGSVGVGLSEHFSAIVQANESENRDGSEKPKRLEKKKTGTGLNKDKGRENGDGSE